MTLYYLGDPCYAMSYDSWDELNDLIQEDDFSSPYYELEDGTQVMIGHWDGGDVGGVDKEGYGYACDSGCYGIVKADDIPKEKEQGLKNILSMKGCRFVEFDVDSVAEVVEAGLSPFEVAPLQGHFEDEII